MRKYRTRCSKCGAKYEKEDFHNTSRNFRNKIYKYKHAKCKNCRNKEKREYNATHSEQIRKYNQQYWLRKKNESTVNC